MAIQNGNAQHVQQVYEQHIKPLPLDERLQLIEIIAHDLGQQHDSGKSQETFQATVNQQNDAAPVVILSALPPTDVPVQRVGRTNRRWQEVAGVTQAPLGGEDAQTWVSHIRAESDSHRDN